MTFVKPKGESGRESERRIGPHNTNQFVTEKQQMFVILLLVQGEW